MSDVNIIRGDKFYHIPEVSVGALVFKVLQELDGETICAVDAESGLKLTINELLSKSQSIAKALIGNGVKKSDMILIFAENSIEMIVVLFAGMFLGLTLYPITPIANVYELQTLLESLNSLVIFTTKTKSKLIENIVNKSKNKIKVKCTVILDDIDDNYLSFSQLLDEGNCKTLAKITNFFVDPVKDTFLLLQSSGTTGVPKSTQISHHSFVATLLSMIKSDFDVSKLNGQPIFGHMTPFGCISGISFLFGYICCGVNVVFYKQYNEELIMSSIDKYKINFMLITPVFGHKLVNGDLVDKYDLSSLVFLYTGGAAFPGHIGKAIIKKYGILFQEVYGMTEYGTITLVPDMTYLDYIPGCLGRPGHNTMVKIIDINTGKHLGPDLDGEICVKGPKLFIGYLNNPSATVDAIDNENWLRTGDIGHYDHNNRLFITDRLKELIKFGTKQVSPSEIEQFLLTHECIAEVAVVGVKHQTQSQWPRAYVKVKDNMSVTEDKIKKYVSDNLNEAKELRAGVVFVDSIPRTTMGKVDRRHFKQLIKDEVIFE